MLNVFFNSTMVLFSFVWLVIGTYWTFGSEIEDQCPIHVYSLSALIIALGWGLLLAGMIIICVLNRRSDDHSKKHNKKEQEGSWSETSNELNQTREDEL